MEILHICLKSRYPINPNSLSRLSSLILIPFRLSFSSSTETAASPLGLRQIIHPAAKYSPIKYKSELVASRFEFHRVRNAFRRFSSCSTDLSPSGATTSSNDGDMAELNDLAASNFVIESIVDVVRRDEFDMEFLLDSIGKVLSKCDIFETLRTLNRLGLNALRFFRWIQNANPKLCCDAIVCSLMVDNCGRLGDYQTMLALLKDFGVKKILLTVEAFSFLEPLCSTKDEFKCSVKKLVSVLEEADGTCCNSGICALIQMCCAMNYFDVAKFVAGMNKTESVFYRVWLRESCLRGRFEEAREMLHEMRQTGCHLDTRTYNYLISCLLKYGMIDHARKVLEEMLESGCPVNALTYEILICQSCKADELDGAVKSYQMMVSRGIEPRLSTCSAIIKAYFNSERYEESYNFLIHVSENQKCLINALYSLLANLHRKEGDLVVGYNLLMEMIDKGLKPDFAVYMNVSKKQVAAEFSYLWIDYHDGCAGKYKLWLPWKKCKFLYNGPPCGYLIRSCLS